MISKDDFEFNYNSNERILNSKSVKIELCQEGTML